MDQEGNCKRKLSSCTSEPSDEVSPENPCKLIKSGPQDISCATSSEVVSPSFKCSEVVESIPECEGDGKVSATADDALEETRPGNTDRKGINELPTDCTRGMNLCNNKSKEAQEKTLENTNNAFSIQVQFQSKSVADLYQSKFLNFFESFNEFEVKFCDDLNIKLYRKEMVKNAIDQNTISSPSICTTPMKKVKKKSKIKKELFTVDANPSGESLDSAMMYTSKFLISGDQEAPSESKAKQQQCFNCGKPHSLKDCTLKKDYTKINAARQKFMQPRSTRYHLEEEQKYSHLIPGQVSNELRKALGLHIDEAPHYIYLMREFGYPPGWLEEAKFVHSNLDMFDIDGKNVQASAIHCGLDAKKVVNYPGFNVPFEEGIKDDFRLYGVPPFSDRFKKEAMIQYFNEMFSKKQDDLETFEMDIDIERENGTKESYATQDLYKRNKSCPKIDADTSIYVESPSLKDLEQRKQQLIEELINANETDEKSFSSHEESNFSQIASDMEANASFLSVKASSFGTPILKSSSPYVQLPEPDNFSKDVSPVINFENLPNSTGKYEQMANVIQKVRTVLKKIQNMNS